MTKKDLRQEHFERDLKKLLKDAEHLGYLKSINRVGSIRVTMGWLIGYFVILHPLRMILPSSPIWALAHSIFGVAIACLLLWGGRK